MTKSFFNKHIRIYHALDLEPNDYSIHLPGNTMTFYFVIDTNSRHLNCAMRSPSFLVDFTNSAYSTGDFKKRSWAGNFKGLASVCGGSGVRVSSFEKTTRHGQSCQAGDSRLCPANINRPV